jgi:type II restriction enzyme
MNDHNRTWDGKRLGEYSINKLPSLELEPDVLKTISLIDVLWLDNDNYIVSGFEVEKSTSIYSGMLRLNDLSLSLNTDHNLFYLIAPEKLQKVSNSVVKETILKLILIRSAFHQYNF